MKILLAAGIAVIAIAGLGTAGFLTSVESATINISLPAWRLDSWAEVHGAPSGGQFQTQRQQVTLTETTTGTASGSVGLGGSYATGSVVLNHSCRPGYAGCTVLPALPGYNVCRGPQLPNPPQTLNICYVLQGGATCFCGESVRIRAYGPGSGSNMPANSINVIGWNEPYGTDVYVSQPAPITGGGDPTFYPSVRQSDIDAAAASARAQLSTDLLSSLLVRGGGLMHLIPDGTPHMTVTPNVAAGARTKTFQVTATGSLGATEFQDAEAQAVIAKRMDQWVPKGYRLNGAPVVTEYQVASADEQGDVTVSGRATDYMIPSFSLETLRSQLRGAGVGTARAMIEAAVPASRVEIQLTPATSPVLPLNSARISFSFEVRAATPL